MKALICPLDENLVIEVVVDDKIFDVAQPLYWQDCPSNIVAGEYYYVNNEYVKRVFPPIPATENKKRAVQLLQETDWTTIADVADPALSNPYLMNQAAFFAYRSVLRAIAVNPTAGDLTWPTKPQEQWSS
jgi:hypothetical protein